MPQGGRSALLSWNNGGGDGYQVTLLGPDDTLVRVTTDTSMLLENLTTEVLYTVEVRSMCRYQYYSFDSTYVNPGVSRLTFWSASDGVVEAEDLHKVELFPNPADGEVTIRFDSEAPVSAALTDLAGREVKAFSFQRTTTVDVSHLPAGQYILRLATANGVATRKLVVGTR